MFALGAHARFVDDPLVSSGRLERIVGGLDRPVDVAAEMCGQVIRKDVGEMPGDLLGKIGIGE
ncbi:hypothetical protein CFP66_36770 [Pseudonocardia sp. MH-G8]|nr:hypothetical protein CFP66_36770 [Pseudonocardia sp. MH-G8]